jgi:hypothetical protein
LEGQDLGLHVDAFIHDGLSAHFLRIFNPIRSNRQHAFSPDMTLPGEILTVGRVVATGELKEELVSSDAV